MQRFIKLISILIISMSVYWVYQKTRDSYYEIMSIGDQFSLGITSYGTYDNSYLDNIKDRMLEIKENVEVNTTYDQKDQSIKNSLFIIENTPDIRKDFYDTDLLILSLGYNDLIYALSSEESNTSEIMKQIKSNYNDLIREIRKYYKEDIVVIGYMEDDRFDSYKQEAIQQLNNILKNNPEVIYIDINELLEEREKYYSNPRSNYPNTLGYKRIAEEIIQKTLENK